MMDPILLIDDDNVVRKLLSQSKYLRTILHALTFEPTVVTDVTSAIKALSHPDGWSLLLAGAVIFRTDRGRIYFARPYSYRRRKGRMRGCYGSSLFRGIFC